MFLNFISFINIMIGVVLLGVSLGIVIGAYFENNDIGYFVYFAAFLAGLGSIMVVYGALRKRD